MKLLPRPPYPENPGGYILLLMLLVTVAMGDIIYYLEDGRQISPTRVRQL